MLKIKKTLLCIKSNIKKEYFLIKSKFFYLLYTILILEGTLFLLIQILGLPLIKGKLFIHQPQFLSCY